MTARNEDDEQPSLLDPTGRIPAPAHRDGSDTEYLAAQMMTPKAGTLRERALLAIARADDRGLTDHELADATEVYLYSIAPRRTELVRMGWVEDSGDRRDSPMKRPAVVWVLTAAGRAALTEA